MSGIRRRKTGLERCLDPEHAVFSRARHKVVSDSVISGILAVEHGLLTARFCCFGEVDVSHMQVHDRAIQLHRSAS